MEAEKVELGKKITRKQAIKKAGITALASTSLLLLNTPPSAATSGVPQGNNGWGNGDQNPPGNSGDNNDAENAKPPKPSPLD